ncbi:type II secretion system F family protein [Tessaracoccus rhinocerotis]|uniref:Type II secretion system F family protein n=1 Tax=Tessaracoccus rhinocerotis TaxID=1689449 RepID=A0A553JWC5_9ACTN|nr:type II secretion system F family protein [Tessaracoccus rhinocerotis]TRY16777.1 type II secretion system F family protein [Tessaracoccus rhinocerotis]
MSWPVACGALLVMAAWLAFPEPNSGLRRLEPAGPADGAVVRLLAGRSGAPPLRQRLWLGVGAGALVLAFDPGPAPLAVAAGVCAGVAFALGWMWPVPGPDPSASRHLPGTLELLASCLEAGASMRAAVETVAAVSHASTAGVLERVAGELRLGRAEADAWSALATDPVWGAVARDVARSARSGTSLVEGLLVHAEDRRRHAEAELAKVARSAGVRSVLPLMVCFLPAFVLVGVVPTIAGLLRNFLG